MKPFKCDVVIDIDDGVDDSKEKEVAVKLPGEAEGTSELKEETNSAKELEKDILGTFWMKVEQNDCDDDEITTYVVELPLSQHNKPEVKEAKVVEMRNLRDYETFKEVEDWGQERISSIWVFTVNPFSQGGGPFQPPLSENN